MMLILLVVFVHASFITYDPSSTKSWSTFARERTTEQHVAEIYQGINSPEACSELCQSFNAIQAFQLDLFGRCSCLTSIPQTEQLQLSAESTIYAFEECKSFEAGSDYCEGEFTSISSQLLVSDCAQQCRATYGCTAFIFSESLPIENCRISTTCTPDIAQNDLGHWNVYFSTLCSSVVLNELCTMCKCKSEDWRIDSVESVEACVTIAQDMGVSHFSYDPERDLCTGRFEAGTCSNIMTKTNMIWSMYEFHELNQTAQTTNNVFTTSLPEENDAVNSPEDFSMLNLLLIASVLAIAFLILVYLVYHCIRGDIWADELFKETDLGEKDRKARLSIDIETPATVMKVKKMPTPEAWSFRSMTSIDTEDEDSNGTAYNTIHTIEFPDITNPVEMNRYEEVVNELNLDASFDFVSFKLVILHLEFSHSDEELYSVWTQWESKNENPTDPASQLEILVKLLEDPMCDEMPL